MNRPTDSTDWKDAEPNPENQGQYNCAEVRCNFYTGGGGTPDPLGYPPQAPLPSVTLVPRSMPCFRCIQRLEPFQFLPNFYYFYICQACTVLKMYYWVVLTAGFADGLSTPTEHPQNFRSYFVSSKLLLSYHYVHLMVLVYSSMGISSVNP